MKKKKIQDDVSHKKTYFFKRIAKEYSSAFKATGTNHVYYNRKSIIKSIALCFIPFLYAFIALLAFFDPLGNINRLPIAFVNQDVSATGNNRVINVDNLPLKGAKPNKIGAYEFDVSNIKISEKKKTFKVYYFDNAITYLKHQNDITFLTEILINSNFTKAWNIYFDKVFEIIITAKPGDDIWSEINKISNKPEIILQGSYKVNPILGEINDFVLNTLKNNIFGKFFPIIVTDKVFDYWQKNANDPRVPQPHPNYNFLRNSLKTIYDWLSLLVPGLGVHKIDFINHINAVHDDITWQKYKDLEIDYWKDHSLSGPIEFIDFNINIIGQDKSPYGFGLGPYFMCIGMWVGGLLLTFNFTRKCDKEKSKFWSNYLAKASWMVIFGLIQATILTTALLLLFNNLDLFKRFWQFYLFMWFMAICFDLIVQGIAHMFRDHDLGRFLIVILLVLQLSASGGTFPVELEPGFFRVITHILPFTYAIRGLRQILIAPDLIIILINTGIMIAIVAIVMLFSLFWNWLYNFLDAKMLNNPKFQKKKQNIFEENKKDNVIEEESFE